jgi:hypothetical protein
VAHFSWSKMPAGAVPDGARHPHKFVSWIKRM